MHKSQCSFVTRWRYWLLKDEYPKKISNININIFFTVERQAFINTEDNIEIINYDHKALILSQN
jgi:hypothetical protein